MRPKYIIQLFLLTAVLSCDNSDYSNDLLITRNSIQGNWLLISEHTNSVFQDGRISDTVAQYNNVEMQIDENS